MAAFGRTVYGMRSEWETVETHGRVTRLMLAPDDGAAPESEANLPRNYFHATITSTGGRSQDYVLESRSSREQGEVHPSSVQMAAIALLKDALLHGRAVRVGGIRLVRYAPGGQRIPSGTIYGSWDHARITEVEVED